jgi:hypothetical protein
VSNYCQNFVVLDKSRKRINVNYEMVQTFVSVIVHTAVRVMSGLVYTEV